MIKSTLFVRIVPQDRERGYMMLVGFDSKIVQRTAANITTLSTLTRADYNRVLTKYQALYNASDIKDVTASAIAKKVQVAFGEKPTGNLADI